MGMWVFGLTRQFKCISGRGHPWNLFKYEDTLDFNEKCKKPDIPRESDFNFIKFELARVVYPIKTTIEGV